MGNVVGKLVIEEKIPSPFVEDYFRNEENRKARQDNKIRFIKKEVAINAPKNFKVENPENYKNLLLGLQKKIDEKCKKMDAGKSAL